jgi:alpha-tubulin suppressor-like RCC1 family protein
VRDLNLACVPLRLPVCRGGTPALRAIPDTVMGVVAIAAGHQHMLVLRQDGRVIAWCVQPPLDQWEQPCRGYKV